MKLLVDETALPRAVLVRYSYKPKRYSTSTSTMKRLSHQTYAAAVRSERQ